MCVEVCECGCHVVRGTARGCCQHENISLGVSHDCVAARYFFMLLGNSLFTKRIKMWVEAVDSRGNDSRLGEN